ncbi:PEP-CTERM sorting domain-containing protein [Gemmatimonas sp.]|uniref:PEP-CTERM sorting domain-containing protein n=1 Tax=Gemmatimonas sp. TaxID=1962908 RepID=UPI003567BFA7
MTYAGTYAGVQNAAGADCPSNISQTGGQGDNYWNRAGSPSLAYAAAPPDNISFIQYVGSAGGTITFSQAVIDPWIALISVGQPGQTTTLTFSDVFTIASRNSTPSTLAYWDQLEDLDSGINPNNLNQLIATEFSGVLQFKGTFTSLTIATNGENWHGFTVGATSVVPEPSTYALMSVGLIGMGVVARRRRKS